MTCAFPDLASPRDGYVFIVTYGRSGSTLTQRLLNTIDGYCIRGENGNLAYFLARAVDTLQENPNIVSRRSEAVLPPDERSAYLRDKIGRSIDPWYGIEDADPSRFAASLFDGFVRTVLQPPPGTRVAGFKEIRYHWDLEFLVKFLTILEKTFPNPRFVFQTRACDELTQSGWWQRMEPKRVEALVRGSDEAFRSFMEGRDNCFHIDHREYRDGDAAVRRLFAFLGEPFDERSIAPVLRQRLSH